MAFVRLKLSACLNLVSLVTIWGTGTGQNIGNNQGNSGSSIPQTANTGTAAGSTPTSADPGTTIDPAHPDMKCFEGSSYNLRRSYETGIHLLHQLHDQFVGSRHFEIVELVSVTQANNLIQGSLSLLESAFMGLFQVLCPMKLHPLYDDGRVTRRTEALKNQILYFLDGTENDLGHALGVITDLTSQFDSLLLSVAHRGGNVVYSQQKDAIANVFKDLIVAVLQFVEPMLADVSEHYMVPNYLPLETLPRHEHGMFSSKFGSESSVYKPSISPEQARVIPDFVSDKNTDTYRNEINAVFAPRFMSTLANPNPDFHSSGLQFQRICSFIGGQGSPDYGAFFKYEQENYGDYPIGSLNLNGVGQHNAAANPGNHFDLGGFNLHLGDEFKKPLTSASSDVETAIKARRNHKTFSTDSAGVPRRERSLLQLLRAINQKHPLSYFVISYALDDGGETGGNDAAMGGTEVIDASGRSSTEQQKKRIPSCRGQLLHYDASKCLSTEAGWASYRFLAGTTMPYNVTVSYRGRLMGPGNRLADLGIHTTNTMSRIAQWSSMISLYKSVNHYSPDVLFIHPLVGNCLLLKRLLTSGPVKPKIVKIAINPALPPPIEVAPDMRSFWEQIDEKKRKNFNNDKKSIVWRLQCSLEYTNKLVEQYDYVLDHLEHFFAVFVWKKVVLHDEQINQVKPAYTAWSTGRQSLKKTKMDSNVDRKNKKDEKMINDPVKKLLDQQALNGNTGAAASSSGGIAFQYAFNPIGVNQMDQHVDDVCLISYRPSALELSWLKGWYCSPIARVIADLEYDYGFDLSPLVPCQGSSLAERKEVMCKLFNHYKDENIPIISHNIGCLDAPKSENSSPTTDSSTKKIEFPDISANPNDPDNKKSIPIGSDYGTVKSNKKWIPAAISPKYDDTFEVDSSSLSIDDPKIIKSPIEIETSLSSWSDYELRSEIERTDMSVLQAYASRVIHEKPMLKWFIEKDNRGRCYDNECECFPPFRGPTCELEDPNRVKNKVYPNGKVEPKSAPGSNGASGEPSNAVPTGNPEGQQPVEVLNAVLHFTMPSFTKDLADIQLALPSIWEKYNKRFDYPIVIFHEGLPERARRVIVLSSPNRIWFATLGRDFASWDRVPSLWREEAKRHAMPFPLGYRHMCRWRSGPMFQEPVLQRFEYGMTLDTDSYLPGTWSEDPFMMLKTTGKVAAFPHLGREAASVAVNFLYYYLLYCKIHNINPRRTKILASLVEKNWKWYQQTFMSDIEVLYLPWFRDNNGEYQKFFRYMDNTGGFYLYRWGNNPFRTFAMGTFLHDEQVSIATLPYMHQEFCTCGGDQTCVPGNNRLFSGNEVLAVGGILPPKIYNRTCPDDLIQREDAESLDRKLLHLQPWRGLDWQVEKFEKKDFANFVLEQSRNEL